MPLETWTLIRDRPRPVPAASGARLTGGCRSSGGLTPPNFVAGEKGSVSTATAAFVASDNGLFACVQSASRHGVRIETLPTVAAARVSPTAPPLPTRRPRRSRCTARTAGSDGIRFVCSVSYRDPLFREKRRSARGLGEPKKGLIRSVAQACKTAATAKSRLQPKKIQKHETSGPYKTKKTPTLVFLDRRRHVRRRPWSP